MKIEESKNKKKKKAELIDAVNRPGHSSGYCTSTGFRRIEEMAPRITIYCPCNEKGAFSQDSSIESSTKTELLDAIKDPQNNHTSSSLLFCSECQSIRCRKCVEPQFLTNYCPHCLSPSNHEYNYCVRNCCECPLCSSDLTITASSEQHPSGNKAFIFKCSSCFYRYNTGPLNKPKSLSSFIRSKISNSQHYTQFSNLQKIHITGDGGSKLKHWNKRPAANLNSLIEDLRNQNLENESTISFDEKEDVEEANHIQSLRSSESIIPYKQYLKTQTQYSLDSNKKTRYINKDMDKNENQKNVNKFIFQDLLPLPKKLKSKKLLKCKVCRSNLIVPNTEEIAFKFMKTSNAGDILPLMRIDSFPNYPNVLQIDNTLKFILSFKNPNLYKKVSVLISTFDESHSEHHTKVNLPCNRFVLGKLISVLSDKDQETFKDTKDDTMIHAKINLPEIFIRTIPTVTLRKTTKLSRVELLARTANNPFWEKINETRSPSPNGGHKGSQNENLGSPTKTNIGIPGAGSLNSKNPYHNLPKLNPLTSAPYIAAQNLSRHSITSSQESLQAQLEKSSTDLSKSGSNSKLNNLTIIENDQPLDSGASWCSIAMNVSLSHYQEHDYDLEIPLFLSVDIEGKLCGYWTVARLGRVSVGKTV